MGKRVLINISFKTIRLLPCIFVLAGTVANASVAGSPALGSGVRTSATIGAPVSDQLAQWCSDVRRALSSLNWKIEPCDGIAWKIGGHTVEGRPIVYAEFGDKNSENTTLIFSSVHGDEITPVYLGVELVNYLRDHSANLKKYHVVVAPLVNPDGFFKRPRTRMNAQAVDVNRNFDTSDWATRALKAWKTKFHSDPRRFPGSSPRSEPETVFQEELIKRVRPQKILSVHAPLNFLDYDGPTALSLDKFPVEYVQECLRLRKSSLKLSAAVFSWFSRQLCGPRVGNPYFNFGTADRGSA